MANRFLQGLVSGVAILTLAGGAHANKVTICHKDINTISIAKSAWPAHKDHGDVWGSCDNYAKYSVVVIFRCGISIDGGLTVTTVNASEDIPVAVPLVVKDDNCADANAALMNAQFDLTNITSGSVDTNFETEYVYTREYLQHHKPK